MADKTRNIVMNETADAIVETVEKGMGLDNYSAAVRYIVTDWRRLKAAEKRMTRAAENMMAAQMFKEARTA